MPSSLEAGPSIKHDINVTPLADVMLVLLIIFMVITPLLHPGVEVQVPEAEHSTEHPEDEETLRPLPQGKRQHLLERGHSDGVGPSADVDVRARVSPRQGPLSQGERASRLWLGSRSDGAVPAGGCGRSRANNEAQERDGEPPEP